VLFVQIYAYFGRYDKCVDLLDIISNMLYASFGELGDSMWLTCLKATCGIISFTIFVLGVYYSYTQALYHDAFGAYPPKTKVQS